MSSFLSSILRNAGRVGISAIEDTKAIKVSQNLMISYFYIIILFIYINTLISIFYYLIKIKLKIILIYINLF